MTSRFQACIGPGSGKAHIRDLHSNNPLVLCESTIPVRNLKGKVSADSLCQRCGKVMLARIKDQFGKHPVELPTTITADLIGVEEII